MECTDLPHDVMLEVPPSQCSSRVSSKLPLPLFMLTCKIPMTHHIDAGPVWQSFVGNDSFNNTTFGGGGGHNGSVFFGSRPMLTAFDMSYVDGHGNTSIFGRRGNATAAAARNGNDGDADSWVMLDDDMQSAAGNPGSNRYPATPGINAAPSSTPFIPRNVQRLQPGAQQPSSSSLVPVDRDLATGVPVTSASMYMDRSGATPDRGMADTSDAAAATAAAMVMTGGRMRAEDAMSARLGSDVLSASAYGDGLGLANDSMMQFADDSLPAANGGNGNGNGSGAFDGKDNGFVGGRMPPSFVPVTPRTPPMAHRAFTPMTAGNKSVRFNMPLDMSDVSEAKPLIASTSPIGSRGGSGGILRKTGGSDNGAFGSSGDAGFAVGWRRAMAAITSPSTVFGLFGCLVLLIGFVATVVGLGMSFHPIAPRHCHDLSIAGGSPNSTETMCLSTVDLKAFGCSSLPVHEGCTQVAESAVPPSCHLPM